ncbi:hypothetical protein [Psychromonas sp. MME2]|uniref:DUF7281 domain-containing protein n=1 Tax=unclassified Psychromonas TaxID=2614957 RepID=UPI00339C0C1B
MDKKLYQFCQRNFKTLLNGKLKYAPLLSRLNLEYGFGERRGDYLYFDDNDRQRLIERVQQENDVHLFRQDYIDSKCRVDNALKQRNEKVNSQPVSEGFVLINAIDHLRINGQHLKLLNLTSLGCYIEASEITAIDHPFIVLVENLAIMAKLDALILPEKLRDALFIYRGDIKPAQRTNSAYQLFRHFKSSHQLVCFSDLDPAGIQIAVTCGAHFWLAPEDFTLVNSSLTGDEHEWFNQSEAIKWLARKNNLPKSCQTALITMQNSKKTLKQEHILAHNIKMNLYPLD